MDKAALVTGGAKRIGKSIAVSLADMGYAIAIHYHTSEGTAQETAAEIRNSGAECEIFKCNLSNLEEVMHLVAGVQDTFPNLALLVNNASIFEKAAIAETEPDSLNRHFNINFTAPFLLMKEFANQCKKGHIINILDARITQQDYMYAAYTLSKKALAELTRMAAVEFAPEIRVNAIAPGIILTPYGESEAYLDRKSKNIPLQRKGNTSDIAHAVRFLEVNNFITGQIIYVDGGENL